MTILVYHHNDLDGICAAAIIAKRYNGNIKPVSVQYDKDTWDTEEVKQAEKVYVVDFTFPDMEALAEVAGDKLVWCDHHKTAMEQHKDLWESEVDGIRSLELSGCELTWSYCYYLRSSPLSVKYIGDRDMWKFEHSETKAFCAGINAVIESPLDEDWNFILSSGYPEVIDDTIRIGEILLKTQERRVKRLFESGSPCEIHGCNALIVNSTSDISELGEYIYTHGFELAVIWHVKSEKIIVSLRSNTVDCAEIAQKYGGGGHKGAAGFSIPNTKYFPLELI